MKTINNNSLEKIVQLHYNLSDNDNINLAVRYPAGKYLYATEQYAKGISPQLNSHKIISSKLIFLDNYLGNERCNFVNNIHKKIIEMKSCVDYIIAFEGINDKLFWHTDTFNILNNNTYLIETQFKIITHNIINTKIFNAYLNRYKNHNILLTNTFNLSLTSREELILSLTLLNFTQSKIADILKVSRSYISKTITEYIAPKLGISCNATSSMVIEKAIAIGYHQYLSPKLLFPNVASIINLAK